MSKWAFHQIYPQVNFQFLWYRNSVMIFLLIKDIVDYFSDLWVKISPVVLINIYPWGKPNTFIQFYQNVNLHHLSKIKQNLFASRFWTMVSKYLIRYGHMVFWHVFKWQKLQTCNMFSMATGQSLSLFLVG